MKEIEQVEQVVCFDCCLLAVEFESLMLRSVFKFLTFTNGYKIIISSCYKPSNSDFFPVLTLFFPHINARILCSSRLLLPKIAVGMSENPKKGGARSNLVGIICTPG